MLPLELLLVSALLLHLIHEKVTIVDFVGETGCEASLTIIDSLQIFLEPVTVSLILGHFCVGFLLNFFELRVLPELGLVSATSSSGLEFSFQFGILLVVILLHLPINFLLRILVFFENRLEVVVSFGILEPILESR